MKARIMVFALLLMLTFAAASAQEFVSISEVYDQAQAMGGWWKETFDTPHGEVTIDTPVIVPDVETMPVITVKHAKISEELFQRLQQGKVKGDKDALRYEIQMNGEMLGFFLGYENAWIYGTQTDVKGYDAVDTLWIYHGGYLPSLNTGMGTAHKQAQPTTFHFPWQIDADAPCVRDSAITLNEAMQLWHEDIEMCYPGEGITIRPTLIKLRGSTLETDSKHRNERAGYLVIESAEQLINGIPLMGTISGNHTIPGDEDGTTAAMNRIQDSLNVYCVGSDSVGMYFYGNFTDVSNYRTSSGLARIRTTEYADVPLASLDSVLGHIKEKIEEGFIRKIHSIKLGYLLYSNPDMTDYAWAIPRWEVKCDYVTESLEKTYRQPSEDDGEVCGLWGQLYSANLPVDAQSGELILFTYGDKKNAEVFSVPEITTWDDVR